MSSNITILKIRQSDHLYSQVLELRNEALRKPIGLSLFDEDLDAEADQHVFAAILPKTDKNQEIIENGGKSCTSGNVIGCVMLAAIPNHPEVFQLRQMAVSEEWRGRGVGKLLVQAAEKFSVELGKQKIFLNARSIAKKFYLNVGYSIISGEYIKKGIPHYDMQKVLF